MKKLLTALTIALCFSAFLSAYEWGGVVKNVSTLKTPDFSNYSYRQSDGLFFWYTTPIADTGFKFALEGLYSFSYSNAPSNGEAVNQILDIDLLKFSKVIKAPTFTANINFGRFNYTDETKTIFNQNMDGASVKFTFKKIAYKAAVGYTGLLNEKNVSILSSKSVAYGTNKQFYKLAYPYLVADLGVNFNNLFAGQNLKFEVMSFIDLGAEEKNRVYLETVMSGPIVKRFTYNASFILQTLNFEDIGLFAALNTFYTFENNMYIKAGVEYASGASDSLAKFATVSSRTVTNSYTLHETTSMILPGVQFVYVGKNYYWGIDSKFLMDYASDGFKAGGVEADFIMVYNLFSDLQLGFDIFTFTDISGASVTNSNYGAELRLTFTF